MSRKAVIAVAAVVAIVAAGVALLIVGGGSATANEVRFQTVSEPGPDPFTAPAVATASSESSSSSESTPPESNGSSPESTAPESTPSEPSDPSAAAPEGQSDAEPQPGTFGGTGDNKLCDREKLIEELSKDPQKLSAWAETAGIEADPQTVADFIRKLRPSTLTQDTQVTNHSFSGGEAKGYQAILEKGTAVLVDEDGKAVARCRCGNPLAEPLQLEAETKCIECPANYTPPPPCEAKCFKPEPTAPPVKNGTGGTGTTTSTDSLTKAKDALEACRTQRGGLDACATEYEQARAQCAKDPLNAKCDSTVCFEGAIEIGSDGCPSYLGRDVALGFCLGKFENPTEKNACIKRVEDLQKKCLGDPQAADCKKDPKIKRVNLIGKCIAVPSRPECAALQVDCAKDSTQFRCDALKGACTTNPARPDCKAVTDLKQACAKDPTKPECKGVPKTAAPTLAPEEETGAPTEEPGTGEETGGGTDTGGDAGGDAGGGAPTEPAPETTPGPDGQ